METDSRPEDLLRLLEDLYPAAPLDQEIQYDENPNSRRVPQLVRIRERVPWLAERRRAGSTVIVTSGETEEGISVALEFGEPRRAEDGGAMSSVTVWLSLEEASRLGWASLVGRCGDVLRAFHLTFSPAGNFLPLFLRTRPAALKGNGPDLSGLPMLTPGKVPSVDLPIQVGWLNYWSRRTAELLGFPDPSRDAEWLAHAVETPEGAWVVQITPDPFDGSRQDHIDALARAYRRFDQIGVRR